MTGVSWPASMSRVRVSRSARCCPEMSMVSRWRVNGEWAGPQLAAHAGPAAAVFAAGEDQRPGRGQRAPQPGQWRVAGDVQDEVVALRSVREVIAGVVQDVVGANRGDQIGL